MIFLVFEGLDGSGKSSLMKQLEQYLELKKIDFIKTREPGGTVVGDSIREIILQKSVAPPTARTELLLYQASRAQHVDLVIKPALENKKWVLCDRFSASSVAFQAGGRNISLSEVEWLNSFSTTNLKPNLQILLDLTVEESKNRRANRSIKAGVAEDRIEAEASDFHHRVREGFLAQAKAARKEWLVLDAAQSQQKLFQELLQALRGHQWLD